MPRVQEGPISQHMCDLVIALPGQRPSVIMKRSEALDSCPTLMTGL
jgi:hypothetical protein